MRLRDLGLIVGDLQPGAANAVTDVTGVRVGHATAAAGGLTAVIPFADRPRRCFVGRWSLDGGDQLGAGLAMAEDFGALSTPWILTPPAAAGRVYDGLLSYGFGHDPGLTSDAAWPPGLLLVDGGPAESVSLHAAIGQTQVAAALSTATTAPPAQGQVGIGRGLAAFGARAGIGTASRQTEAATVGVLLAANGGEPQALAVAGARLGASLGLTPLSRSRRRTFGAVVVTDAPLLPHQLDRLAQRSAFGLVRVGLLDGRTQSGTVVAVSTTGLDEATGAAAPPGVAVARVTAEGGLAQLFQAGAEACEEAVLDALVAASTQPQIDGSPGLPVDLLRDLGRPATP